VPTPLEELSDWAVRTDAIPSDVHDAARRVLMDQVGVSLGGAQALNTLVRCEPSATLWSTGERVHAPDAALANRFAGDDLELNAGPEVAAAGIAAGEVADATLGELYVAMAVASEVESYVRAWFQRPVEEHGLHPPAVFGALSAATVAAKLCRLDTEAFSGALGTALALAPQSHYASFSHGATGKWLYGAWSQRLGLQAALWARMGIAGASTTLDGAHGIAQAFLHETTAPPAFQPNGWALTEVTFKAFPCSRACHPALTALEKLGPMDSTAILRVDIWSYPFSVELEERSTHASPIADQMSVSAMVRQALGINTDRPIDVRAEGVNTLPRKREARVRIVLQDGSVREAASQAKWSAVHPATAEELRTRFLEMTRDKRRFDPWDAKDSVRVRELVAHG
jgi:2-methylcitrate dehydratase PrpD